MVTYSVRARKDRRNVFRDRIRQISVPNSNLNVTISMLIVLESVCANEISQKVLSKFSHCLKNQLFAKQCQRR